MQPGLDRQKVKQTCRRSLPWPDADEHADGHRLRGGSMPEFKWPHVTTAAALTLPQSRPCHTPGVCLMHKHRADALIRSCCHHPTLWNSVISEGSAWCRRFTATGWTPCLIPLNTDPKLPLPSSIADPFASTEISTSSGFTSQPPTLEEPAVAALPLPELPASQRWQAGYCHHCKGTLSLTSCCC